MKLTVESVKVKDVAFSDTTAYRNGVLRICKDDIVRFAEEEGCFDGINIDLLLPGQSARIVHVVDVVQPRCKKKGQLDWPGVLSDEYEITGSGATRAVDGLGIVMCQNNTYWSRKWGSFDMCGPCAEENPYAQMPELVLEPLGEVDFRDYREALRRIGFKTSVLLAQATLDSEPDSVEVFDNEEKNDHLPNIVYSFQIYSKQYDTRNYREPMFYGNAIPDNLPVIIQPTEVLDGAISTCGGFRSVTTYEIQNHPVILELMRKHGKELNFAGIIITVTSVEAKHRYLVSKMVASMLKEVYKADGVIVTKGVGGASTLCVGAIAGEAEKLGIKAVPIIQILNSNSNLDAECLISEQNVDSIVQSGTYYHYYDQPEVERIYGGPQNTIFMGGNDGVIGGHKIASGAPAIGKVSSSAMKQVGLMSQVGNSHGKGVDY